MMKTYYIQLELDFDAALALATKQALARLDYLESLPIKGEEWSLFDSDIIPASVVITAFNNN